MDLARQECRPFEAPRGYGDEAIECLLRIDISAFLVCWRTSGVLVSTDPFFRPLGRRRQEAGQLQPRRSDARRKPRVLGLGRQIMYITWSESGGNTASDLNPLFLRILLLGNLACRGSQAKASDDLIK